MAYVTFYNFPKHSEKTILCIPCATSDNKNMFKVIEETSKKNSSKVTLLIAIICYYPSSPVTS